MTEPITGPGARRRALAAHPVASVLTGLILTAAIACTLVVPIYAHVTPRVGDFPFFYFYLLVCTPAVAVAMWIAMLLQRRITR
jgi:hypothetical protein